MTDKNAENSLSEKDFLEISTMEPKLITPVPPKSYSNSGSVVESLSETAPDSLAVSEPEDEHHMVPEDVELEPQPSAAVTSDYFDDDEEFLRGDDIIVHEENDLALFKQDENVVSWEIVNFYKDGLTPRGKMALRNDPPIMKISSSSGDTAEFLVTKDFSKSLGAVLQDVNKAYYGISPKKKSEKITQAGVKDKIRSIGHWMLDHKVKTAVAVVVAALLFAALIT
jgi:hypothetical protein